MKLDYAFQSYLVTRGVLSKQFCYSFRMSFFLMWYHWIIHKLCVKKHTTYEKVFYLLFILEKNVKERVDTQLLFSIKSIKKFKKIPFFLTNSVYFTLILLSLGHFRKHKSYSRVIDEQWKLTIPLGDKYINIYVLDICLYFTLLFYTS